MEVTQANFNKLFSELAQFVPMKKKLGYSNELSTGFLNVLNGHFIKLHMVDEAGIFMPAKFVHKGGLKIVLSPYHSSEQQEISYVIEDKADVGKFMKVMTEQSKIHMGFDWRLPDGEKA